MNIRFLLPVLLAVLFSACDKDRPTIKFSALKDSLKIHTGAFDPNYNRRYQHFALTFNYQEDVLSTPTSLSIRPGPMPTRGYSGSLRITGFNVRGDAIFTYRIPSPLKRKNESEKKLTTVKNVRFEVLVPEYAGDMKNVDTIITAITLEDDDGKIEVERPLQLKGLKVIHSP